MLTYFFFVTQTEAEAREQVAADRPDVTVSKLKIKIITIYQNFRTLVRFLKNKSKSYYPRSKLFIFADSSAKGRLPSYNGLSYGQGANHC